VTLWKVLAIAVGIGFVYLFLPAVAGILSMLATAVGVYVIANWFLKWLP
jgi:hypothetical protein